MSVRVKEPRMVQINPDPPTTISFTKAHVQVPDVKPQIPFLPYYKNQKKIKTVQKTNKTRCVALQLLLASETKKSIAVKFVRMKLVDSVHSHFEL